MRTIVKGKNVEVPDRVREYAERKLQRIGRLTDDRTDAIVELSNEKHKSASDAHRAEVTLIVDGATRDLGDRAYLLVGSIDNVQAGSWCAGVWLRVVTSSSPTRW